MSVRGVQACTDAKEFAEWLAFQSIDPASEERADLRAAMVATIIANLFRGKGGIVARPIDFMPYATRPQRTQPTTEEVENKIAAWARGVQAQQAKARALRG